MEFRTCCGKKISCLGLGTGRLASLGAGYTRGQAAKCLELAAASGINLVDTADSYGSGDCERLLGRLLREIRHPFLISTKAGYRYCRLPAFCSPLNQVGKKIMQRLGHRQCFEPKVIRSNLEHSLKRLRRERADFFFLHDPTVEALADELLVNELLLAQRAGKIGRVGISCPLYALPSIPANHPFASLVQTTINPWAPMPEHGPREILANHVFGGEMIDRHRLALHEISAQEGLTVRQLLVAYAGQQKGVWSVLVGTGNAEHLKENLGALGRKLSADALAKLARLGRGERV